MKRTIEEHATRFDERADAYDDTKGPEYHRCRDLVIEYAGVEPDDIVLDLGTGTGAIALALAPTADHVVGRDISEGMLERAIAKADERGLDNLDLDVGRFRGPNYDGQADIITSNFALHHLSDAQKHEAITDLTRRYQPRRFVLGDVMFFDAPDPEEPFYNPEVDDPATVGRLAEAFTAANLAITVVESVHPQVGVIVAEVLTG